MIKAKSNKFYLVCCVDCSYLCNERTNKMTKKESFLNRILDQIKVLQLAYDSNKNLPDYIFENMQAINLPANIEKNVEAAEPVKEDGETLEYGANKKWVMKILEENNKAMLKADIVDRYLDNIVMPEQMAINTVTNSLAALSKDNVIKGHKPAGLKFKGKFWTLAQWWEGDKLPLQYEPYSGKISEL